MLSAPFDQIAVGCNVSLGLGHEQMVWHWGTYLDPADLTKEGVYHQPVYLQPERIEGLYSIERIYSGIRIVAIDDRNQIWAWGNRGLLLQQPVKLQHPTQAVKVKKAASNLTEFIILLEDGTVWEWQLLEWQGPRGYYRNWEEIEPIQAKGLSNIVSISANSGRKLALRSDGTVWGWESTKQEPLPPTQITGISECIAVRAIAQSSFALLKNGTLWSWGRNDYGQLGIGSTKSCATPTQITKLENVVSLSKGVGQSFFAITEDQIVWGWGFNRYGELAIPDTDKVNIVEPTRGPDLKLKEIHSGGLHTLALDEDDNVWTWGNNKYGQLGTGTGQNEIHPVQLTL